MRAAVLLDRADAPVPLDFHEPEPTAHDVVIDVEAAALSHLYLIRASASGSARPVVAGGDGIGRLADGRRVYFDTTVAPYGSLAERTLVATDALLDVADGVESPMAAALGNAGLAAWLSLQWRAGLRAGETVIVLGASGSVGTLAVQVAKALGAARVVAAARGGDRLQRLLHHGADATVALEEADLTNAMREATAGGANLIIDTLWGSPALAAISAAAPQCRHVQIGALAGETLELPASRLRSAPLAVLGFAVYHAPIDVRRTAYLRLTELAARGDVVVDLTTVALADVADAWERQRRGPVGKLVIVPG